MEMMRHLDLDNYMYMPLFNNVNHHAIHALTLENV